MSWLASLSEIAPESTRSRVLVLLLDRVLIGAVVGFAFVNYDIYRADRDAQREDRALQAQLRVERARASGELLPSILDRTSEVGSRGYLLSSALSAELIAPEAAIELLSSLHREGILNSQFLRIAGVALPAGLAAVGRHGARLRDEARAHGNPGRSSQVTAVAEVPSGYRYVAYTGLSAPLQAVVNERLSWAAALREALPRIPERDEREVVTRRFLTEHVSGLYFVFQPIGARTAEELFHSSSMTLRLIGALDCVIQNWGPTLEAAIYVGQEFASLDLASEEDVLYAEALVGVLREHMFRRSFGIRTGSHGSHVAIHLAELLVDDSFRHRVSWLPNSASPEQRRRWWAEESAASAHSSLQFVVSEVLTQMGERAENAEPVLTSFVNEFVQEVDGAETQEALQLVSSRYGSYSVRTAVAVLRSLDSETSRAALESVRQLGDDKLTAFEGVRWLLGDLE